MKVYKDLKKRDKKAFEIIPMNLNKIDFAHVISSKGAAQAPKPWKTLWIVYENRNFSNVL